MTDEELDRLIDKTIEKANETLRKLDELEERLDRLDILINKYQGE